MHDRPVIIAPAPSQSRIDSAPPSVMPFTCQPCVRRKVKCDRSVPACLSCGKAKLECIYQPPAARACKRKRVDMDEHKRLARCEQMFQEHGILTPADATMAAGPSSYRNNNNIDIIAKKSLQSTPELSHLPLQASNSNQSDAGTTGKLLSGDGKSRYIDSSLWLDAEEVDMREISEHEEEEEEHDPTAIGPGSLTEDPISGALLGGLQSLGQYYPSHVDAMKLWTVHVHNVEPLCKILHIPTTTNMVEIASQQPATASKANECLLFAIYHSAVFSMTDEDCVQEFSQSRTPLMLLYRNAFQQALVNASWLKTTEMPVLQALVLFLVAMRTQMDPHTFWILTGVAVRIAQRMGLHRDAQTILDTDIVLCSNPNMKNFQWQIKAFFLWDALLCMLTSLAKVGFLSSAELDTTWKKMGEIYSNHPEILEARKGGALHIAVGKLTLKAWAANSPSDYDCPAEPAFITTLRSLYRETKPKIKGSADYNNTSNPNGNDDNGDNITNDAVTEESLSPSLEDIFASLDGAKLDFGENNFNLGSADWTFWDQSYR
ncbi:fungal-specific transcription factor domain-containing protein [Penicillium malachiteum]|uniref:Fungal-specific transcription factor domain-containing protein n=1 Tax=Penicillium malachiteum TaxID=1324776 RepID=A0AAD6HUJ2_9EURO|nr:fungal-specific transcription factor domain-containing protein [Penicillium malachiteum]